MALDVLPHQIPETDQRYDVCIQKSGFGKGSHNMHLIIINGKYAGHRISTSVDDEIFSFVSTIMTRMGYGKGEKETMDISNPKWHGFINRHSKKIRLSLIVESTYQAAINEMLVEVDPEYQESNVMVTYEAHSPESTAGDSEIDKIFRVNE